MNNQLSNISIVSYNCKGFKSRNFNYLKKLFAVSDILLVQEHWLYNFEFSVFNKVLPNCRYIAKSSMQSDTINYGRPYGGIAIIWKDTLSIEINEITTLSDRLCVTRITNEHLDIILINVYMPCNESVLNEEFIEILFEIVTICNTHEYSDVVLAGDFNCDISLNDFRSSTFSDFLSGIKLECLSINPKFKINYTFVNSLNNKSLIDHFCVSQRINDSIISFIKYDEGDNLSDHLPLILKFSATIDVNKPQSFDQEYKNEMIDWFNANEMNIEEYMLCLDKLLNEVSIPFDALNCLDINCKQHENDYQIFLNKILDSIELAALTSIPIKLHSNNKDRDSKRLLGWNFYVKQYHTKAILWHRIWKENECPADGYIAEIRRKTRSDYHKAINDLKKNQDKVKRTMIGNTIKSSNPKFFWKEVSKISKKRTPCPSFIDGQSGEAACNIFRDKYEVLYGNKKGSNLMQLVSQCKNDIEGGCLDLYKNDHAHLHNITHDMVNKAIKMLKNDKSDTEDGIYSNSDLNAPYKLSVYLSFLFTIMLRHGFTSEIFNLY